MYSGENYSLEIIFTEPIQHDCEAHIHGVHSKKEVKRLMVHQGVGRFGLQ